MLPHITAIDFETGPFEGAGGLSPWGVSSGRTYATALAIDDGTGPAAHLWPEGARKEQVQDAFRRIRPGTTIVAWRATFDAAWAAAYGVDLRRWHWLDGPSLWKWVDPMRTDRQLSLIEAAKAWLDAPWKEGWIELKRREKEEGFRPDKDLERYVAWDATACVLITRRLLQEIRDRYGRIPTQVWVEGDCVPAFAEAWLEGIPVDPEVLEPLRHSLVEEKEWLERELRLDDDTLSSPQKLGKVLYEQWGLPTVKKTPGGDASTDKEALHLLALDHPQVRKILEWRKASKGLSTYVLPTFDGLHLCQDGRAHPSPNLFGTYTGRCTYSSKLGDFKAGPPLHQIPRDKRFRAPYGAPEGFLLMERDWSGQEMRLMADRSKDANMVRGFLEGKDMHLLTGAEIGRLDYTEALRRKFAEDEEIVGPRGLRYLGKFDNLSLQYRTGLKTLRTKALVDYDIVATEKEVRHWSRAYHNLYPGVRRYWRRAIRAARELGYSETMGGRRIWLPEWKFRSDEHSWGVESTAINHPIQGTGADMKEAGIATLYRAYPEIKLAWDLHDGLYYYVPILPRAQLRDLILSVGETLNSLPYKELWGREPIVPMIVDGKLGHTWAKLKEI